MRNFSIAGTPIIAGLNPPDSSTSEVRMKITDITNTPLITGKGLLRILTDTGVEGWAEAPGHNGKVFNAYLETAIKPALLGEDP